MAAIPCVYPAGYRSLGQTSVGTKPRSWWRLYSAPQPRPSCRTSRTRPEKSTPLRFSRFLTQCAQPKDVGTSSDGLKSEEQLGFAPEFVGSPAGNPSSSSSGPIIAGAAAMVGVALFLATRLSGGVPLSALETSAVPLDIALGNGRPSVVEFYADWCEVCREMAPDVFALEKQYGDKVNWVMLNIDNPKWDPELEEYRVDGIPHFVFLDDHAQAKAEMIGRLPKGILEQNTQALATGAESLPIQRYLGKTSALSAPADVLQSSGSDPRSHG